MSQRSLWYLFAIFGISSLAGCGASGWSPAPPSGRSWSYGRQGALRRYASVNSDTVGNLRITTTRRGAYRTDGPVARPAKGRAGSWSAPLARFNRQLAAQGVRLEPSTIAREAAKTAVAGVDR